jgi:hypothetical protein
MLQSTPDVGFSEGTSAKPSQLCPSSPTALFDTLPARAALALKEYPAIPNLETISHQVGPNVDSKNSKVKIFFSSLR